LARIAQIQVSYAPLEDRLLLRMSTEDGSELRFWLTRRFIKLLAPVLNDIAQKSGRGAMIPDSDTRRTVADFERGEALAGADFSSGYEDGAKTLPLGESPILLARIQTQRSPTGTSVVSLHPQEGTGVELALDGKLLYSLMQLLEQGIRSAEWEVAISDKRPADVPQEVPDTRVLN
jgi:hypothetical protein